MVTMQQSGESSTQSFTLPLQATVTGGEGSEDALTPRVRKHFNVNLLF